MRDKLQDHLTIDTVLSMKQNQWHETETRLKNAVIEALQVNLKNNQVKSVRSKIIGYQLHNWREERIDAIGRNGGDGLHYEQDEIVYVTPTK